MIKVRARIDGLARFKGGLRCRGSVYSVVTDVTREINFRYNYKMLRAMKKHVCTQ